MLIEALTAEDAENAEKRYILLQRAKDFGLIF